MSPSDDEGWFEFVVSHELAEAARRDGVTLPEGYRVCLVVVASVREELPVREIPWLGMVDSGEGDLGARVKEVLRDDVGR